MWSVPLRTKKDVFAEHELNRRLDRVEPQLMDSIETELLFRNDLERMQFCAFLVHLHHEERGRGREFGFPFIKIPGRVGGCHHPTLRSFDAAPNEPTSQ